MSLVSTTDNLYRLLLFTAMILLMILLHNNIVLYRRKFRDFLSLMLMATTSMCAFEIIWEYCDGNKSLEVISYIGACGYVISFLLFGTTFNRFFLEQLGLKLEKRWMRILFYLVPNIIMWLLCITTPWTQLIFWVDGNGVVQEMEMFSTFFYGILLVYLFSALAPACYYTIRDKSANHVKKRIAQSMLVFGILAPLFFVLEMLIMGSDSDFLPLSLACSVALVYLSTNVNTHLLLDTQAKVEAVETDLRIAAKIQTDALPPSTPDFSDQLEMSLCASMNTAREVGGDFYDYFVIDDHRLCFLIADVSGKGTPAALFMMTTKTMIKDHALICDSTSEIFTAVNRRLCENNDEGMFATAWIGIVDTKTKILQYTNAGHNYPIIKRSGEQCAILKKKHGLFLAGMDDTEYRQDELQLYPGDRLLLFTDGVTEAHSVGGQLYGEERLMAVVDSTTDENGEEFLSRIVDDVNHFAEGEPQFDDITMITLMVK